MFGAGAPLMGAGGQGFDPRRMMGGPQAGNTQGSNPFGRGSSGGADQFGIGGGPGGGPGGSAMASGGGAPPWQQPPGGGMPPGLQGGPMGAGGPSPYQAQMGGGVPPGMEGRMGNPGSGPQWLHTMGGGQGMAGGNMGPGGSGGIFAGGGGLGGVHYGPAGSLTPGQNNGLQLGQQDPRMSQLGMNVQGGNMGPKPMSPIGAGAYGQAGGNMGPGGGQMDQVAQASRPPGPGGPTGSMANMESRLARAGMPPEQIQRRLQMAQDGRLPWQQAQGQQGGGATTGMDAQGAPVTGQPAPGRPRLINRGVPGGPVTGMNTRGENPFGRGSSGGAGAFAVDDGSNGGGPSSAGEAGSTSRLDVIGGRGAAVRPRGGIADGRPTKLPKPGGSGGIVNPESAMGMLTGKPAVSGVGAKPGGGLPTDRKPPAGGSPVDPLASRGEKRQSMAGKAFGKLKA